MIQTTVDYIDRLINAIPIYVYEGLLSIFLLCLVVFAALAGVRKGLKLSLIVLLAEYVILIFCSTVIFRDTSEERLIDLTPFRTFTEYNNQGMFFLSEAMMNIIVFIPIGFIGGIILHQLQWWKIQLLGTVVSVSIETLQFLFRHGFCELDDVLTNSLGCLMGIGIWKVVNRVYVFCK